MRVVDNTSPNICAGGQCYNKPTMKFILNRWKGLPTISVALIAVFFIVTVVFSATVISTSIQTDGTLSVTGTSTLLGNVGVGTTTTTYGLNVAGDLDLANVGATTSSLRIAGAKVFSVPNENSVYIGVGAGANSSILSYSTALGFNALGTHPGNYNVAIGWGALAANSSGSDQNNVAVGLQALNAATASRNTAVGLNAMRLTTTGGNNTSLGYAALGSNTTGSNNTALGNNAMGNQTIGDNNILIGNGDLASTTGSNQLKIGNYLYGTSIDAIGTGRLGIGTTTPSAPLHVTSGNANATTTIEIGKLGQNKGSCLVMYDVAGTVQYVTIQSGAFVVSATSCR